MASEYAIPEAIVSNLGGLITILKALGGAIIIYIGFSIVMAIINRNKRKELTKINENLEDIKSLLRKNTGPPSPPPQGMPKPSGRNFSNKNMKSK